MEKSNIYAFVAEHQSEVETKVSQVLTEMVDALGFKTEKELDAFGQAIQLRGYSENTSLYSEFFKSVSTLLSLDTDFISERFGNNELLKPVWRFKLYDNRFIASIRFATGSYQSYHIGVFSQINRLTHISYSKDFWPKEIGENWVLTPQTFERWSYDGEIASAFALLFVRLLENKDAIVELAQSYAPKITERFKTRQLIEMKIKQENENDKKALASLLSA